MAGSTCANCGSGDATTLGDRRICLNCGEGTLPDGTLAEGPGPEGTNEITPQSLPEE